MPPTDAIPYTRLNTNLRILVHNLLRHEPDAPPPHLCVYTVTDPTDPDRRLVAIYTPDGALIYEEPDDKDNDDGSWWEDYQRHLIEESIATQIKVFGF